MKKITLITGSPRVKGNSMSMADSFEKAAKEKGFEVDRFDAGKLDLVGCKACNACYRNDKPCAIVDAFNPIAKSIEESEGVVFATPVYWYTLPAQIKSVLDHFYAFMVGEKDFAGKKCALISCCEEESMDTFKGLEIAFDKSFELLKAETVGKVLIPSVLDPGDIGGTEGEKLAAELADKF